MTTELDEIKNKIAETEGKLKQAEVEAEKSGDLEDIRYYRSLLLEQQKKENFLLAEAGD